MESPDTPVVLGYSGSLANVTFQHRSLRALKRYKVGHDSSEDRTSFASRVDSSLSRGTATPASLMVKSSWNVLAGEQPLLNAYAQSKALRRCPRHLCFRAHE